MQFSIEVINVQSVTKPTKTGSYVQLDVAYKRLDTGKIEGKKVMSFVNKDIYDIFNKATNGMQFTITSEKDGEYWQWTKAVSGSDATAAPSGTPSKATPGFVSPKSTYETPEERAKRQVLIVRQSSITAAIGTLKNDKKELTPASVLETAQVYNNWVFQENHANPVETGWEDMENDIPL